MAFARFVRAVHLGGERANRQHERVAVEAVLFFYFSLIRAERGERGVALFAQQRFQETHHGVRGVPDDVRFEKRGRHRLAPREKV